ncbi:hypothetical protein OIU84_024714 [Salix udensis]|uniref:Endonuclease/exonuclease/phosphatase domain-containing protein n=1 Tax=Salix udensis TaxID=889485 RepID=A0AAD6PBU6_9ROSI|nr:hypothetical protein OIU84_024714 [Salix udensis]
MMHRFGIQGWSSLANSEDHLPCRILVCWNPQTHAVLRINQSPQWTTCRVTNKTTQASITITVVYGYNTPAERQPLWNYIQQQRSITTSPWILLGDFNAIMHPRDRAGGVSAWPGHMEDFPNCIDQSELIHLPYSGPKLSWNNGQSGSSNIQKKLDWVFGNQQLIQNWPATTVMFQPRHISDHSDMIVHIHQANRTMGTPPRFKFINAWTERADFMALVERVWQTPIRGNPIFRITTKNATVEG